jgi:hypothetical protein
MAGRERELPPERIIGNVSDLGRISDGTRPLSDDLRASTSAEFQFGGDDA